MRHAMLTVLTALAALGLSTLAGQGRRSALVGSGIASATAVVSLLGFAAVGRSAVRPLQKALAVFAAVFLARLVLVALGTAVVVRGGGQILAFLLAFFVPYFVFTAIEVSFLHSMHRHPGTSA
jgi:hypothetical protein